MNSAYSLATNSEPSTLADIYQPDVAIAIWQRQLSSSISDYTKHLMAVSPCLQTRFIEHSQGIATQLQRELPLLESRRAFIEDITLMVEMFSCLFELDNVGVRLNVLRKAMCPKFHVDRVPCRLICTYAGEAGTEWLAPRDVDRVGGGVIPRPAATPNNIAIGDVALLKGETWEGNEGKGLVHRSPSASELTPRLVLTLDFS